MIDLYSIESGQSTQVTDGLSDARYPAFDHDGQYLYFTASTNYGPGSHPLDMTSDEHRVTRNVYALVLSSEAQSPVAPESDEEKPKTAEAKPDAKKDEAASKPVRIDLAGMDHRVVSLPIPARDYTGFAAGKTGLIYVTESLPEPPPGGGDILSKFDLKTRKVERMAEGVAQFDLSADGEKMLLALVHPGEGPAADGPAGAAAVGDRLGDSAAQSR